MTEKATLEVRNVSKRFGSKLVLDNLTFSVNPGEIVGFLGPNGSGKTTAIKIILGLLSATSGEVFINGYNIRTRFEDAMRKVGGIIESPELYGYMSGYDNLMQYARLYGCGRNEVLSLAARVKLAERINDKVSKYSLGMRQRLGVAQALIGNPNLLILDEPTNGLDPSGIKDLRDLMRSLAAEGVSIFVSSHLLSEMEMMCDRFLVVENGVVLGSKTIDEVTSTEIEGRTDYHFVTSDNDSAISIATDLGAEASLANSGFVVNCTKEDAAQLVMRFCEAGVFLYSMEPGKKTLEDAFFEITNDQSGQIR